MINVRNTESGKMVLLGATSAQVSRFFEQHSFDKLEELDSSRFDSEGHALVAGALYVCAEYNEESEVRYGGLYWFGSDGKFYDANYDDTEGAEASPDFDYLVRQTGPDINPKYIFS